MSAESGSALTFVDRIECRRESVGPLGLTLIGRLDSGEPVQLAFLGAAPADLPSLLDSPRVERTAARLYRISVRDRSWIIEAPRTFLHRDVGTAFYTAVPPRRVPWRKRALLRVLLAALASPLGRRWP